MARPIDEARRDAVLDAIVGYIARHGIADLSLRPLAKAVGSSPRVLLYYFGSSEQLVARALARMRDRQRALYATLYDRNAASPAAAYFAVWRAISSPAGEPLFRLFFEVYGLAVQKPERYRDFLAATVDDWLAAMSDPAARTRRDRDRARATATIVIAGFRGFMIDYLASRDRARVDRAVKLWLASLTPLLGDAHG
jgi:AcrR family transcriptional regulator